MNIFCFFLGHKPKPSFSVAPYPHETDNLFCARRGCHIYLGKAHGFIQELKKEQRRVDLWLARFTESKRGKSWRLHGKKTFYDPNDTGAAQDIGPGEAESEVRPRERG